MKIHHFPGEGAATPEEAAERTRWANLVGGARVEHRLTDCRECTWGVPCKAALLEEPVRRCSRCVGVFPASHFKTGDDLCEECRDDVEARFGEEV